MGTYFDNAELDTIYERILSATIALCGSIGGTGLTHIHNALLSKAGLTRNTAPTTPGDYLKGIAVCARKINGRSDYLTGSCTLSEIATCLENPADVGTLSASLIYSAHTMKVTLNKSSFKGTITSIKYVLKRSSTTVDTYTTLSTSVTYPRGTSLSSGTYAVTITVTYTFNGESATTTLTTSSVYYTASSSGGGSGGESGGGTTTTVSIRVANGSGGYKTVQIAQSEIASTYPYKVTCQWAEGDHSSYGISYYYDEDTFEVTCSCGNVLGMVAGEPYGES